MNKSETFDTGKRKKNNGPRRFTMTRREEKTIMRQYAHPKNGTQEERVERDSQGTKPRQHTLRGHRNRGIGEMTRLTKRGSLSLEPTRRDPSLLEEKTRSEG